MGDGRPGGRRVQRVPRSAAGAARPRTSQRRHRRRARRRRPGETLRPLGVTGVLAPVIDVGPGDGAALGARAFSDDPERVAGYASAVVTAYRRARVFSAVEALPWPGHRLPADRGGAGERGPRRWRSCATATSSPSERPSMPGLPAWWWATRSTPWMTYDPRLALARVTTDLLRGGSGSRASRSPTTWRIRRSRRSAPCPTPRCSALQAGRGHALHLRPAGRAAGRLRGGAARRAQGRDHARARLDQAVGRILSVKRDYGLVD